MKLLKYATVSQRIGAYTIDGLILAFLLSIILSIAEPLFVKLVNYYRISFLLIILIVNFIFALRDFGGQGIGKRIFKIKVVSVNGKKITLLQKILRYLPMLIWPLDFWTYWGSNFKERLGDKISKTKVIQTES